MIITEHPWNGRNDRIRHASDSGLMIEQEQTGNRYVEAIDIYPTEYTYRETNEQIEQEVEEDGEQG